MIYATLAPNIEFYTRLGGLLPTKEGKEDRGRRDGPVPSA
jgi:hypothetical protein